MVQFSRVFLSLCAVFLVVGRAKEYGPVATTDDITAYVAEHGSESSDDLKPTPIVDAAK